MLGPDYKEPEMDITKKWNNSQASEHANAEEAPAEAWWKKFNDPTLTHLIKEAVEHNHDVRVAFANIEQARAARTVAASPLFPTLGVSASGTKTRIGSRTFSGSVFGGQENDDFSTSLDASWEIDVFGKIRRSLEAAEADVQVSIENKRDVLLSIIAEVANNYFQVRGYQKRIDITKRNIKLLSDTEKLAKAQFDAGVVTEFDFARAKGERQASEATLPNLESEMMAGIYRISVLTGTEPEAQTKLLTHTKPLPSPPDIIPVGLRSSILQRRPDIRRAERTLASATANIGIAKAGLFPDLSLTGTLGSGALLFSDLFSTGSTIYNLSSAINWSLFQGGALRATIDSANAKEKAALASYEKTVLVALEEVEASLSRYGKEWQTFKKLEAEMHTREKAFNVSRLRYETGEENFLVVLDAERSLVTVRDNIVNSETRILVYLTQLYKALGGGWQVFEEKETPKPRLKEDAPAKNSPNIATPSPTLKPKQEAQKKTVRTQPPAIPEVAKKQVIPAITSKE
jgi:multidrug efflux system outer membrane protein